MKTFFKILIGLLVVVLLVACGIFIYLYSGVQSIRNEASSNMYGEVPTLESKGHTYRDLNKNGQLDIYEDSRQSIDRRVDDLLAQMTVAEKAGQMFHPFLFTTEIPIPAMSMMARLNPPEKYIINRSISHVTSALAPDDPLVHVRWANRMQKLAEQTRLGIPLSFSSDPRHSNKKGAAVFMKSLSQWPDAMGFAALRDSSLTVKFGQIAQREYRAIGLHTSLHPVADLATEPRWGRIAGTFGEDADLSAMLTAAYIKGMQGDSLHRNSVSTMTKHFSGGGPQKDGWDAHFKYGKEQVYPGDNFAYHLIPFKAAIKAGTAQMMPYYGIPMGQTSEDVGFAFNKEIISDLLQDSLQFEGIVCSDWGILADPESAMARFIDPMDHGVEDLDVHTQTEKALNAGIDQFGGNDNPEFIVKLVEDGRISEGRIDRSVRKLLKQKFILGLFDNPYIDENDVTGDVGRAEDVALGFSTMMRSTVLLKNLENTLPLSGKPKVFIENLDKEKASTHFDVVDNLDEADFAILKLEPPFEPREGMLESFFHQGSLAYTPEEVTRLSEIMDQKPTIIAVYLERPIVIPEINEKASAILGHFSISDEAILQLIAGKGSPEGKLPFEMPSSLEAVENQKEDVPFDSENPLYEFGWGLNYN